MESSAPAFGMKRILLASAAGIAAVIVFMLWWLFFIAPANPSGGLGWYLFAFATGLTMIVLPCTLPLAFVIVPLSMGKGLVKGVSIALCFGAGVALMLSIYGVLAALIGGAAIGQLGAPLEVVKNWVYFIAGIFALLFALGEIGLINVHMPSYTGAAPAFIQKRGDYIKAFLLGAFLGNVGVGCPHPATPLLLIEIATSGNVFYGWTLFLTHAIGRILPLILLAVLAISGVNGLDWLVSKKDKIERATGWAMVFVAGFILTLGLFSHAWWTLSGIHSALEKVTQEDLFLGLLNAKLESTVAHVHNVAETTGKTGLFGLPLTLGNWVLVGLWLFPIWWWWRKEKKRIDALPSDNKVSEKDTAHTLWRYQERMFTVISVLLAVIFIWALPQWFISRSNSMAGMKMPMPSTPAMNMQGGMAMPAASGTSTTPFFLQMLDKDGKAVMIPVTFPIVGSSLNAIPMSSQVLNMPAGTMMQSTSSTMGQLPPGMMRMPDGTVMSMASMQGMSGMQGMQGGVPAGMMLMPDGSMMSMTITYQEEPDIKSGLAVSMTMSPEKPKAGEPVTLTFFAHTRPDNALYDGLTKTHEKFMHVIGVRDDLGQFFHIHPDKAAPGTWTVTHTFNEAGNYKIYVDTADAAFMSHVFAQKIFTVAAGDGPFAATTTPPVEFLQNVIVGQHQVMLEHDTPIVAGTTTELRITVKDVYGGGIELDNYLGVPMHMAIISSDLTKFIHTHPVVPLVPGAAPNIPGTPGFNEFLPHTHVMMFNDLNIFAPEVAEAHVATTSGLVSVPQVFQVNFSKPGLYRLFAQFHPKGEPSLAADQAMTAAFFVNVEANTGQSVTKLPPVVALTAPGMGPAGQKVMLVTISLILMGLLSLFAHKKLQV